MICRQGSFMPDNFLFIHDAHLNRTCLFWDRLQKAMRNGKAMEKLGSLGNVKGEGKGGHLRRVPSHLWFHAHFPRWPNPIRC